MTLSTASVFDSLLGYLETHSPAGTLQDLQRAVLLKARASYEREGHWPIIDFPLALHRVLGGDDTSGAAIAGACALFYAYADVTDDAEDHDLPDDPWGTWGWEQAVNTGNALMFACLQFLFDHLAIERAAPLVEAFVRGGWVMTGGQHADLVGQAGQSAGLQAYLAAIRRKSGASFGAYAQVAALANHADRARAERFRELGEQMGMLFQTMNDTHELWGARLSPDFANRRLSFPIVLGLEQLHDVASERLHALLRGPASLERQHDLVALLESSGIKGYATLRIEVYRKQARELATSLGVASDPYLERLLDLPPFPQAPITV